MEGSEEGEKAAPAPGFRALDWELLMAAQCDDLARGAELLSQGADPSADKGRAFMDPVHRRRSDWVELMMPFCSKASLAHALATASNMGDDPGMVAMLARGAEPDALGRALLRAALNGNSECVEELLSAGADAKFKGSQALASAVENCDGAMARRLIPLSDPSAWRAGPAPWKPLLDAARFGDAEFISSAIGLFDPGAESLRAMASAVQGVGRPGVREAISAGLARAVAIEEAAAIDKADALPGAAPPKPRL